MTIRAATNYPSERVEVTLRNVTNTMFSAIGTAEVFDTHTDAHGRLDTQLRVPTKLVPVIRIPTYVVSFHPEVTHSRLFQTLPPVPMTAAWWLECFYLVLPLAAALYLRATRSVARKPRR